MKWQGRRGSRNIEDRRRGGGRISGGAGAGGLGLLAIVVVGYFLGIDVTPFNRTMARIARAAVDAAGREAFVAGDMGRGQSLIVWAIAEGRAAAASVDRFLMGSTQLPSPVEPTALGLR